MTDIETLLSVDAGHTPPGAIAVFLDDTGRAARQAQTVLSAIVGLVAVVGGIENVGRVPVTLLILGAAMLAVRAMPTISDEDNCRIKRQVVVVTKGGLIVRDAWGLRNWRFEDLSDVIAGIHDSRPYLDLIDRKGTRHTVECYGFRKGRRVRAIIRARLPL